MEYYYIKNNKINKLEIKLKEIGKFIDISYMFFGCSSLLSFPDLSKWDISNIKYIEFMFLGCSSLLSLPDISKWDTSNVIDMSHMFSNCSY